MRRRTEPEKAQLAIRLDGKLIARLDALAKQLSQPGLAVTRTDAVRIALMAGLDALDKERRR